MFKFRKDHPYRPVNWRWERARLVKEYGKLVPGYKTDDEWIEMAAKFRIAKDKCTDELSLYRLFDTWPDLAMAYELWDEDGVASGRANAMRYEIEARILANEKPEIVAQKAGLSSGCIKLYEKLFFNVLDRIKNKMYILHVAIGDQIQRGMTDRDFAVLWKLYGYVRGSHMLDYLITTFGDWGRPGADEVEHQLLEDHKSNMKRKAALASRMTGINHHTADRLIELHTKITEVERSTGDDANDNVRNNIQVMLNHLPLLVGSKGAIDQTDPMLALRALTIDLRADELLAMSTGSGSVDPKSLAEYRFPELSSNDQETK